MLNSPLTAEKKHCPFVFIAFIAWTPPVSSVLSDHSSSGVFVNMKETAALISPNMNVLFNPGGHAGHHSLPGHLPDGLGDDGHCHERLCGGKRLNQYMHTCTCTLTVDNIKYSELLKCIMGVGMFTVPQDCFTSHIYPLCLSQGGLINFDKRRKVS